MAQNRTPEEIKKAFADYNAKALANFPFELIEVAGVTALARWNELRSSDRGIPVILGGDHFENIVGPFGPNTLPPEIPDPSRRPLEQILAIADKIHFPEDLVAKRNADEVNAKEHLAKSLNENPNQQLPTIIESHKDGSSHTLSREETLAAMLAEHRDPPLGEWPDKPDAVGLTVTTDILSGKPLDKVRIALLPTNDPTTIPALLRWGNWNENPAPEYHVSALRSWRDRYGAELIGMSFDTLNIRVSHRPQTREEAIALAREQYLYCNDLVEQGFGTFSALAASLMVSDWWYFWWD